MQNNLTNNFTKNFATTNNVVALPHYQIQIFNSSKPISYNIGEQIMNDIVKAKKQDNNAKGTILLLEHEPVYTAGTSANKTDIIANHNLNTINSIPFYITGRGGKYTYHTPGQIVCYLILNLRTLYNGKTPDIKHYVSTLELIVINLLSNFNIKAFTKQGKVGVWVDSKNLPSPSFEPQDEKHHQKIAAIGVRVSGGICFHGFCVNIHPDMSGYNNIIPCGIADLGVCSLKTLGIEIGLDKAKKLLVSSINNIFIKNYNA